MAQNDAAFDPEALQAQIDLSMSLTQELVSSWIHPSYKVSKVNKDTDKELEEYLRRPPRLGVGAPLPESFGVTSRETARLKTKLGVNGKKRDREETDVVKGESSDDQVKGRGGSGTKKARFDPFSKAGKEKNKKATEGSEPWNSDVKEKYSPPTTPQETVVFPTEAESEDAKIHQPVEVGRTSTVAASSDTPEISAPKDLTSHQSHSPQPRKKKKRRKGSAVDPHSLLTDDTVTRTSSALLIPDPTPDASSDHDVDEWTGFSIDADRRDQEQNETVITPRERSSVTTTNLSLSSVQRSPILSMTPQPLLNLEGPPSKIDDDLVDGDVMGSPLSPKKKRRRRKKKLSNTEGVSSL